MGSRRRSDFSDRVRYDARPSVIVTVQAPNAQASPSSLSPMPPKGVGTEYSRSSSNLVKEEGSGSYFDHLLSRSPTLYAGGTDRMVYSPGRLPSPVVASSSSSTRISWRRSSSPSKTRRDAGQGVFIKLCNAFASTLKDTTTTAFEHPRSRQGGRLRRIAVQTRLYAGPLGIRQVQGVQARIWLLLVILFLTWVLLGGPKPSIPQSKSTVPKSALSAANVERAALPLEVEKRVTADHPVHQGLLRVNGSLPVTSHPIYQLIRDAREAWNAKVERQSRTLKEADQEYRRRNGRAPPRGFDQWWKFVVENNVQLPDEYDQISEDLLPYRALSPSDLNRRISEASYMADTYTLKVVQGSLRASTSYNGEEIPGADMRMRDQAELLLPIVRFLDDMAVVYSVHDTPQGIVSWAHRKELEDYVEDGDYIESDAQIDLSVRGWPAACPASSRLRSGGHFQAFAGTLELNKQFIVDHRDTMNLCDHPENVALHGVTSGKEPRVQDLVPVFALSKTKLHSDILGVPVEQWSDLHETQTVEWNDKEHDSLLWRGTNTGSYYAADNDWRASHRLRFVRFTDEAEGNVTVLASPRGLQSVTLEDAAINIERLELNERYMDVGFTGEPLQCCEEDGTCADIKEEYSFLPIQTHAEALHYKYVFDVDGNAWSARFRRLLASGSLILKSTIMPEWWTERIQPWVHYVPVQIDYSEVYDVLSFFRGDIHGRPGEDALAQDIADAGREWALAHWRKVDMTAYVFRLYLEWARLQASHRPRMDFEYDESMEIERNALPDAL